MSRLSKRAITVPEKVKVEEVNRSIKVAGPLGKLEMQVHPTISVKIEANKITVGSEKDKREDRILKGMTWALIRNMITGVKDGFSKELEIRGVGFQAQVNGQLVVFKLGLSHLVEYKVPEGIKILVGPKGINVNVTGIDKQLVGQVASEIRGLRPPEHYKGKGIRYMGEYVIKKAGKATVAVGVGAKK